MGRFHICMPVAVGGGFECFVCHRDMRAELSEYEAEVREQPVATPAGADSRAGRSRSGRLRGSSRDARLGIG